jgi:hypothetical protein
MLADPDRTFVLTIDLGNDAMQTHEDVAEALERTAGRLRASTADQASIRDINGNSVGQWIFGA